MRSTLADYFAGHLRALERVVNELDEEILRCAQLLTEVLHRGNKILIMGNGGSAADAQHMAAELVGRFLRERKPLPAIALSTDTSILTALGNDFGFDEVFRRQVLALARPGDVVIGISTSGRSENVIRALSVANSLGCSTVALLGRDGGQIAEAVDLALTVPELEVSHIQEAHITILHLLCGLIEQEIDLSSDCGTVQ